MKNRKFILSTLCLSCFVFFIAAPVCFADAWDDYRSVKEEQSQQNNDLMQQYRDGKINAQQLEDAWKQMDKEAAGAAQKVEDEWQNGPARQEAPAKAPVQKDTAEPATDPKPAKTDKVSPLSPPTPDTPVDSGGFSESSGLQIENQSIEYRNGITDHTVTKQPGIPKHSNITMKWGVTDSQFNPEDFDMTKGGGQELYGKGSYQDQLVEGATLPHSVGGEWSEYNEGDYTAFDRAGGQLWRDFNEGKISSEEYQSKSGQLRDAREDYDAGMGKIIGSGVSWDQMDGAAERDIDAIMKGGDPHSLRNLRDHIQKSDDAFSKSDGLWKGGDMRKGPETDEMRDTGKAPEKGQWEDHHY